MLYEVTCEPQLVFVHVVFLDYDMDVCTIYLEFNDDQIDTEPSYAVVLLHSVQEKKSG